MSKPETPCLPLCGKIFHVRGCSKWPNAPKAEAGCLPGCGYEMGFTGKSPKWIHAPACPKAEAPPAPPQDAGNYVRCEGCIERGWNGYCTACHPACGCRMIVTFEGVNLGVIHHCRKPAPPSPKSERKCKCGGTMVEPVAHHPYGCYAIPPAPKRVTMAEARETLMGQLARTDANLRAEMEAELAPPAPVSEPTIDFVEAQRWCDEQIRMRANPRKYITAELDVNLARAYLALKASAETSNGQVLDLIAERDAMKAQNAALTAQVKRCHGIMQGLVSLAQTSDDEDVQIYRDAEKELDGGFCPGDCTSACDAETKTQAQELERLRDLIVDYYETGREIAEGGLLKRDVAYTAASLAVARLQTAGAEIRAAREAGKASKCDCDLLEKPGSAPPCNEFRAQLFNPAFCLVCTHVEECHA